WRYCSRASQVLDLHVFTVYVISNEVTISVTDSPQFHVIPIWKTRELLSAQSMVDEDKDAEPKMRTVSQSDLESFGDKTMDNKAIISMDRNSKRIKPTGLTTPKFQVCSFQPTIHPSVLSSSLPAHVRFQNLRNKQYYGYGSPEWHIWANNQQHTQ